MISKSNTASLYYFGPEIPQGSYVLRIKVLEHLNMPFGRFKKGKVINVHAGEYLYIGSAMAIRGSTCLAKRLLRHASRCGTGSPHTIREDMLNEFSQRGLANTELRVPIHKTLRWNVDHLLDNSSVDLSAVYVVRCDQILESKIGDLLENDSATVVFEKGLGANDRPGHTYLLRVDADENWWKSLPQRLDTLRQAAVFNG